MYGEQVFATMPRPEAHGGEPAPVGREAWASVADEASLGTEEVEWQASLFAAGEPGFDESLSGLRRITLDETSWLDHLPRWLEGSDHVFAELVARLPWRQRTVPMYDRLVREPRCVWWWTADAGPIPMPLLEDVGRALSAHYDRELDSIGCNYYRTGADSVAWHGDRIRHTQVDPLVAIVSVGAPRPFLLRPRGGGHSMSFLLGQGDLLVMGGAVQHDWEHSVPKVAAAGPRISITYRHGAGVPTALRDAAQDRSHHPSAGAQNRHLAATGSEQRPGRLGARGADSRGARPPNAVPETEGPPS